MPVITLPSVPLDPYGAFLYESFRQLAQNKQIPKYQFERRVDAILNVFLPEILEALFGWHVEVVAPEFPLKKEDTFASTNVDYLFLRRRTSVAEPAWIFFELKTDVLSFRDLQFDTYQQAMLKGMSALYRELEAIAQRSDQRSKYEALKRRIQPLLLQFPDLPIETLYLTPHPYRWEIPNVYSLSFVDLQALRLQRYTEAWELFRTILIPAII